MACGGGESANPLCETLRCLEGCHPSDVEYCNEALGLGWSRLISDKQATQLNLSDDSLRWWWLQKYPTFTHNFKGILQANTAQQVNEL